ncbi:MAG TPA: hypothetical protein V6C78_12045 [Crinalium sp.]
MTNGLLREWRITPLSQKSDFACTTCTQNRTTEFTFGLGRGTGIIVTVSNGAIAIPHLTFPNATPIVSAY